MKLKRGARVLVRGDFKSDDLEIQMTGTRVILSEAQKISIQKVWAPLDATGYISEPLVWVESYGLKSRSKLMLSFGKTEYKEFRGASNRKFLKKHGVFGIPNSTVTSCVVVTADSKLLIGRRRLGFHQAGNIDAFGGHINRLEDVTKGVVDPFKSAIREICEEIHKLRKDEISTIKCLGLIYNYFDTPHFAIPFVIKTNLTADDVKSRGTDELELIILEHHKIPSSNIKDIVRFLKDNKASVDPEARLTVALVRKWMVNGKLKKKIVRPKDRILFGLSY